MKIEKSPHARKDLREPFWFLAKIDFEMAKSELGKIDRAIRQLGIFPKSGKMYGKIIREIIKNPYRIVYRARAKIEILTIFRSEKRLPETIFPKK